MPSAARQDRENPERITHKLLWLSEYTRTNIARIHSITGIHKLVIINTVLRFSTLDEYHQALNQYIFIKSHQRTYANWIEIESHKTGKTMAEHFKVAFHSVADAVLQCVSPERARECYIKLNKIRFEQAKGPPPQPKLLEHRSSTLLQRRGRYASRAK